MKPERHHEHEHPLREILRIAESAVRASDLAQRELWCADLSWSASHAQAHMEAEDFDCAPVLEQPMRRYVTRSELARLSSGQSIDDVARPIDPGHLVTADLGLAATLDLLNERQFLFMIEGANIAGIITPSDLVHVPVSMFVLSMILASEAGMDRLILRWYGEEQWLSCLAEGRQRRLEERYQQLVARNLETRRLNLLMLEDRLRLVGRHRDLRSALGFESRDRFDSWCEQMKRARDNLAHGRTLLDTVPDAAQALGLVHHLREFANRLWGIADSTLRGAHPG